MKYMANAEKKNELLNKMGAYLNILHDIVWKPDGEGGFELSDEFRNALAVGSSEAEQELKNEIKSLNEKIGASNRKIDELHNHIKTLAAAITKKNRLIENQKQTIRMLNDKLKEYRKAE